MAFLGLILVAIVARDLLHELFHPAGAGTLSRKLRGGTWWAFRRFAGSRGRRLVMAGPVSLVVVVLVWTAMLVFGWALVFLSGMPEGFRYASPLAPGLNDGVGSALYLSLVSLSTLGFGDITPLTVPLRLAAAAEAFLGFILLTAGISWVLSIRPILIERRACAVAINALRHADEEGDTRLEQRSAEELAPIMLGLVDRLAGIRVHLMQSPETYYFRAADESLVLAAALPWLYERTRLIERHADERARNGARVLRTVLDEMAVALRQSFLHEPESSSTRHVLDRYAADHLARVRNPSPQVARVMPPGTMD